MKKYSLKSLVDAYTEACEDGVVGEERDANNLKKLIDILEKCNWEPGIAAIYLTIDADEDYKTFNMNEGGFLKALLQKTAESLPKRTPSEREKIDILYSCLERRNPSKIRTIALKEMSRDFEMEDLRDKLQI